VDIRTKKQQAYIFIRESIISGRYPGQYRLREEHLAKELGVSRGPLREAISQLASEGLLEKVPGLGVYVKHSGREELNELYEIREALESFAAGKAAQNVSTEDLVELDGLCQDMHALASEFKTAKTETVARQQRSRWLEIDLAFHESVIRISKNSRIKKILDDFRIMSQTFREKQYDPTIANAQSYLANLAWAWRDHSRILRALQKRDSLAASWGMALHIKRARKRIIRLYERL
jgi:DNA-binding GntR family transcriptional regulator